MGVESHPQLYRTHGTTRSGSARYRCQGCLCTFVVAGKIRRQRKSHENREVFLALVNKAPIKGIARARGLSPKAVYDKLDFIHRRCMAFVADREREMARAKLGRLYVASDRQDYVLNWTDREDKRNTQLTAIGSADNRTGYVFGMHLNFDPAPTREEVEALAIVAGDFDGQDPAFRTYARYWLEPDLKEALAHDPGPRVPPPPTMDALGQVTSRYGENEAIPDPEAKERLDVVKRLPVSGMQAHYAYTVHAHFRLLRRLIGNAGKIRFYFDQDDTLRAACISAFKGEIAAGRTDAFFVKIDKGLTVDERRKRVESTRVRYMQERLKRQQPDLSDWKLRILLIEEELGKPPSKRGGRQYPWLVFPENTMAEPDKAVCYLTDRSDYGRRRLAILHSRASLHAIDRFFMQVRRLLSMLERPIATPSNAGRTWHGYSPYNPRRVQQLLDIYRVYYNYVAATAPRPKNRKKGDPKRKPGEVKSLPPRRRGATTPAMRLGLARGRVRIEDILYYGEKTPVFEPRPRGWSAVVHPHDAGLLSPAP